jgi:hypothetical protein
MLGVWSACFARRRMNPPELVEPPRQREVTTGQSFGSERPAPSRLTSCRCGGFGANPGRY